MSRVLPLGDDDQHSDRLCAYEAQVRRWIAAYLKAQINHIADSYARANRDEPKRPLASPPSRR